MLLDKLLDTPHLDMPFTPLTQGARWILVLQMACTAIPSPAAQGQALAVVVAAPLKVRVHIRSMGSTKHLQIIPTKVSMVTLH